LGEFNLQQFNYLCYGFNSGFETLSVGRQLQQITKVHNFFNFILFKIKVTTPMLRALGNVCTGPDDYSLMACENPRLMPALLKLLECSSLSHIVKETVWVISNMTSN
jgi:hypothetical protein